MKLISDATELVTTDESARFSSEHPPHLVQNCVKAKQDECSHLMGHCFRHASNANMKVTTRRNWMVLVIYVHMMFTMCA